MAGRLESCLEAVERGQPVSGMDRPNTDEVEFAELAGAGTPNQDAEGF